MPQFYTTTPSETFPAAATGIALTPAAVAGDWSAWTEIISSTSGAKAFSAIVTDFASNGDLLEWEIGLGPTIGTVSDIGRIAGFARNEFNGGNARFEFPALLDNVPSGSKVWVRLRKFDTGTTDWTVALEGYPSPLAGYVPSTAIKPKVYPEGLSVISVTPNDADWADSAWVEIHSSIPAEWTLTYFAFSWEGSGGPEFEVEFGTGDDPDNSIIWTERVHDGTAFEHAPRRHNLWPWKVIPSGSRLWMRIRKQGSGTNAWSFKIGYYENLDIPGAVTNAVQKIWPPAQDGLSVPSSGAGLTESDWVEFTPGITLPCALTRMLTGEGISITAEWDIGTGSAGGEAVKAIFPAKWFRHRPSFPLAINIAANSRIAMRQRQITSIQDADAASLSYIENPEFEQRTDLAPYMLPTLEEAEQQKGLVDYNTADWGDSDWEELAASAPADLLITGIYLNTGSAGEHEIDISLGVEGDEENHIAGTYRFYHAVGAAVIYYMLPVSVRLESVSRISYRVRKKGTDSGQTHVILTVVGYGGDVPDPAPEEFCGSVEEPVLFVSVRPGESEDRRWYAETDLPDGDDFYGGWKEDRLLDVSPVRRSLAGPQLDYEVGTFQIELADEDYAVRDFLTGDAGQYYSRWEVDAYMITPEGRETVSVLPFKVATGQVDTDPEFDVRGQAMDVRLSCRDAIGIAMGWTNTGQSNLPRRALNQTTLPGVVPAMDGKASWLPWGVLSTNIAVPSGFGAPYPSGIIAKGSTQVGAYWTMGHAPWNQTVPAVTGLMVSAVSGGDCPEREFAVQVFPVDASNNVGDPNPYVAGSVTATCASPNQTVDVQWSGSAAKYYVVLYAYYFGWRPQQIIETTGLSCQFDHALDTPDPGTGIATGATLPGDTQFYYYSARSKAGPIVSDWHEVEDPVNYPEIFGTSFHLPNGKIRPIRMYWIPASGADAYQVKKRAAGPLGYSIFNMSPTSIESGLVYWDDDFSNAGAIAAEDEERAGGKVKSEYVRDVVLNDGNTWRELHLGGAAIKEVDDWYYDPGGDPSAVEVSQGDGIDFLVPKPGTAWETVIGTALYRDVLGTDGITRRYAMAYAKGTKGDLIASGISILTFNLKGIETAGDGSGDVIEDLHDQTVHELNYFVLPPGEGYTSGLYGAAPTQGYDNLPIVDTDSFDEVKSLRQSEISGGIVAAGITGARGDFVTVSQWLKQRMVSGDFRMGPNRHWQISASAIDQNLSPLFISNLLTDEEDIHNRTFRPQPRLAELQNVFRYEYDRDYVNGGWGIEQLERVSDSISNWGLTKQGETLSFHYLTDPGVVSHVYGRHKNRRINAPMYVTFEGDLCLLAEEYDLGKYFKVKHWRGVANGGWTERVMWILTHTFSSDTMRVRLDCLDVTSLLGTAQTYSLLEEQMDIDLGGSWYHSPQIDTDYEIVDAYEYRDRRVPWGSLPDGTTVTARIYAKVPSGATLQAHLYDPDSLVIVDTDPTVFTGTSFSLHTFQITDQSADKQYRLRALVSGAAGNIVQFHGTLRTVLP